MTKDELKALGLTDEQVEAVVNDYGQNYVSKPQFNTKNEELKQVKGELTKVNAEIDTLKKANEGNAELTKQIETMKAEAVEREKMYKAELHKMQVDSIVERSLLTAKAKNTKAVRALLNLEDAKIKDDEIVGLSEQLSALATSDPYLFEATQDKATLITGTKPGGNGTGTSGGGITKDQFAKMTYTERAKLYAENIRELKKAHREWSELAEKLISEKNKNNETVPTRNIRR